MGRVCTVCRHPGRGAIDAALVAGDASLNKIAQQYGVSSYALRRHRDRHLSPALAALREAEEAEREASLQQRIERLIERAERLLRAAEEDGRAQAALAAVRELRSLLELLGKASGELNDRPQVTVNLMASPEWLQLRSALLGALLPFPDARVAAAAVLELPAGTDEGEP
ncbi:MAG: hypothetical protein GX624_04800 [Actinobacteria bacterium]|nr:hypothetical protein [Actinomycetota bacterium]